MYSVCGADLSGLHINAFPQRSISEIRGDIWNPPLKRVERSRDDLPEEVEFSNKLRSVLSYPVSMATFYVHPSRSPCEGCICVAGNVSMWCQFCDVKSRGSTLAERHRMLWMLYLSYMIIPIYSMEKCAGH